MAAAGKTLVPLGVVVGAHGVRGDLRVKPYNPSSELLLSLTHAFLRPPGAVTDEREVALVSVRQHSHGLLVTLEECADRDAAQALRGSELCVPREHLPALDEGEHYLIDLVGLEARLADGQLLGEVSDAIEYPAGQALRVAVKDG